MAITIGTITKIHGMNAVIATSVATDQIRKDSIHADELRRNGFMKNDMQIQNDVLAELDREQNVITGTIGVEVHHGVVKLAGHVSDSAIKKNAELAAQRVDDVTSVLMDVDVTGAGTARDIARAPRVAQPR
jgi:osmotically-inducible protein OsmY